MPPRLDAAAALPWSAAIELVRGALEGLAALHEAKKEGVELKIVEMGPFPSEETARQAYNNALPPDLVVVPGSEDIAATGGGTRASAIRTACSIRMVACSLFISPVKTS